MLATLKRDPTGKGFAHLGSDNVVRTFDGHFNIIDSAPVETRSLLGKITRSHEVNMMKEARAAQEKSRQVTSKPRERNIIEAKQSSCVSENCPNDEYCQNLSVNGLDCSWCLIVSDGIGNCQDA